MVQISFIGRQPILDLNKNIFGYELLFRDSDENVACFIGDRYATSKVLTNTFNSFGLKNLVGESRAFINIDQHFIHDPAIETVPAENFMLEILETVIVDEAFVKRVKELKELGYIFVLDDITLCEKQLKNFKPILEYISIIKIDMLKIQNMEEIYEKLSQFNNKIEFLAEKVEDETVFIKCKELGFRYFQGYFFAKPQVLKNKKLDPSSSLIMNIIQKIEQDAETKEIIEEFKKNPDICMNLFKYMNSSSFFTKKDICSIPQALNILGRKPLMKWLMLCMYSTSKKSCCFSVLLETAISRAEIMTMLASKYNQEQKIIEKAYLVGLISLFDAIMQTAFEEIFSEINFHQIIKDAVLKKEGTLGKFLKIVLIIEEGDIEKVRKLLKKINLKESELSEILTRCYSLSNKELNELNK
ncbi:MAG: hypothetical protein QG567_453 [Campylobacterota bacterium]|nr:hypothetical protein [Campylobacterota bacterium]